jgi:hypothetical protein
MAGLAELAMAFAKAHEAWEAKVLLDNKLWADGGCPFPFYEEAVAVQTKRNALLKALKEEKGSPETAR